MRSIRSFLSRSPKSAPARKQPRLGIAFLEDRSVPAVINASLAGGVLTLTAQDAASTEDLVITNGGVPGVVHVDGAGTTNIKFGGVTLASQDIAGVKSIVFNLKGATDSVNLQGVHLNGNVSIYGGEGDNNITLSNGTFIGGNVNVTGGTGDDILSINGAHIGKNLTVNQGTAGTLNSVDVFGAYVGGYVGVTGGVSKDQVSIQSATVGTYVNVNLGAGNDTWSLTNCFVGTNVTASMGADKDNSTISGCTIGGSVKVTDTTGNDGFTMDTSKVGASVTATMGDGDDVVDFKDVLIGGNTSINLGNGVAGNTFNLDDSGSAVGSELLGNLTVVGGTSPDSVSMGGSMPVLVGGTVSMTMGSELAGGDTVNIDDTTFLDTVSIDLAGGADFLNIETKATVTGITTKFADKLTVKLGASNGDTVTLGKTADATEKVEFGVAPSIDGGTGFGDQIFKHNGSINGVDFNTVNGWFTGFESISI